MDAEDQALAADLLDHAQVERHLVPGPAVLWAETPTNPLLRVADLTASPGWLRPRTRPWLDHVLGRP